MFVSFLNAAWFRLPVKSSLADVGQESHVTAVKLKLGFRVVPNVSLWHTMTHISSAAVCRSCWLHSLMLFCLEQCREPAVTGTDERETLLSQTNVGWVSPQVPAYTSATEQGHCTVCGRAGGRRAPSLDHMQGFWKIKKRRIDTIGKVSF